MKTPKAIVVRDGEETRINFHHPDMRKPSGGGVGGQIALRRFSHADGTEYLRVDVWNCDPEVEVLPPVDNLPKMYIVVQTDDFGNVRPYYHVFNEIMAQHELERLQAVVERTGDPVKFQIISV